MGLPFEHDSQLRRLDLGSWTLGFSQNFGWEMAIANRSPLQDPPFTTLCFIMTCLSCMIKEFA